MVFLYFFFFIVGSAVGSFLNVVIDRGVRGEKIWGRSHCDYCKATLGSLDLIPIASFLALGGRCRYCRRKLSRQYPLVEAACGVLFVLAFYFLAGGGELSLLTLVYQLLLLSVLLVVAVVDLKHYLIPTTLVFFASLIALFYDYFRLTSTDFVSSVAAAFALSVAFAIIVLVTGGRGMGTGDIPLVFLIGLFLGWPGALAATFLAFVAGALISSMLLLLGKKSIGEVIPFGPFLVLGAVSALFWGEQLVNWYFAFL